MAALRANNCLFLARPGGAVRVTRTVCRRLTSLHAASVITVFCSLRVCSHALSRLYYTGCEKNIQEQ